MREETSMLAGLLEVRAKCGRLDSSVLLTLFHQQLDSITKSWIYYQFYHNEWAEKLAARTVVNKYFNNEQKHTNDSVKKEKIVDFKKRQRQRKKE